MKVISGFAVSTLVFMYAAVDKYVTAPAPTILRCEDGGWAEIHGNCEVIRHFNAAGQLRSHIYHDLTGVRHVVVYDGMTVISHDLFE